MSDETKTPQAGEWWVHNCGRIRFIVGTSSNGCVIIEECGMVGVARGWDNWHHEPRCTGFDWKPPVEPAIDPGEGWELLPVGTVLQEGDEYESGGDWNKTCYPGTKNIQGWTYRRRKPPAEDQWPKWPKWAVGIGNNLYRADSWEKVFLVDGEGNEFLQADPLYYKSKWHEFKHITEAEALARVKTAEPDIPKLTLAEARELALKTMSDIEETRRPVESIAQAVERTASDRVPDHRPAREVIRDIVSWLDEKDGEIASPCMALETAQQWLDENPEEPAPFAKPFNDPRSGMGIRKDHVSWCPNSGQYDAATDVTYHAETPVESPDDWVDLPDTHILRADIDQVLYEHDTINYWQEVCPSAGMRLNDSQYKRARCRRRDLPAPQPKRTPVRLFVSADVRWGDRYIVSVKDGNPNPERHQEIKFDGSGFYVEGE